MIICYFNEVKIQYFRGGKSKVSLLLPPSPYARSQEGVRVRRYYDSPLHIRVGPKGGGGKALVCLTPPYIGTALTVIHPLYNID